MTEKIEPEQKARVPQNSELDKVLKHCLTWVKEDLRKKTPNPKARRTKIDDYISTREI
jgi:hypothetical protein